MNSWSVFQDKQALTASPEDTLSRGVLLACNRHLYSKHCSENLREKMLTLLRFSASEPSTKSATTTCPLALSSSKTRPIGRGKVTFKISLSTMRLQIRSSCRRVHEGKYSMAVPNQSCKQSKAKVVASMQEYMHACMDMCVLHTMVPRMSVLILCNSGAQCCATSHKQAQGRALHHLCMPHRQAASLSARLSSQCASGPTADDIDISHKTQKDGTPHPCASCTVSLGHTWVKWASCSRPVTCQR